MNGKDELLADGSAKWRILEESELPQAGDEAMLENSSTWEPVKIPSMWLAGGRRIPGTQFRRAEAGSVKRLESAAEIPPCPFCGGTDIRFTNHGKVSRAMGHLNDDVWSTCCYTCGATFPNRYRREILVEQWKRRPPIDPAKPMKQNQPKLDSRNLFDRLSDRLSTFPQPSAIYVGRLEMREMREAAEACGYFTPKFADPDLTRMEYCQTPVFEVNSESHLGFGYPTNDPADARQL